MSVVTLDIEALEQAANYLSSYIEDIQVNIKIMKEAALDCVDNMESDAFSKTAIVQLEKCIAKLLYNLADAEDLKQKILTKKIEIEKSINGFNRK